MSDNPNIPGKQNDPIAQALRARDLPAAQALLEQKGSLSWLEAAVYAPLTFLWSARLLELILDLGPKEELLCAYQCIRSDGGWEIRIASSLLGAAAAADDLESVELLLAKGYRTNRNCSWDMPQCPRDKLSSREDINQWYIHFIRKAQFVKLDNVWMRPVGYMRPPKGPHFYDRFYNSDCDPLADAIWCGAVRCVKRLLPGRPEELSLSARQALSWKPLPGDEKRREEVTAIVEEAMGMELAELLTPDEILNRDSPLFLPCLARHPEWFSYGTAELVVKWSEDKPWAWEALPLIPPEILFRTLMKLSEGLWRSPSNDTLPCRVLRHPEVHTVIDRCAVPINIAPWLLLEFMDHSEICGDPPAGGLSGLAAALLLTMLNCLRGQDDISLQCRRRLLKSPRVLAILGDEDQDMISAFLRWQAEEGNIPYQTTYLLSSILELKKEENDYAL